MKRLLLLIILLSSKPFAQGFATTPAQDTLYFNTFYEATSPEHAKIIRVIEGTDPESNGYIFKEFDKNGKLEKSGITRKLNGKPSGLVTSYHKNGIKKDEGFLDETRKGLWKEWYQNGHIKEEAEYRTDEKGSINYKMINFYDSVGNHLVMEGTGLYEEYYQNDIHGQLKKRGYYKNHHQIGEWEGFHKNGQLHYQNIFNDAGKFVKGTSYDLSGNRYDYTEQEIQPAPVGGMIKLYRFISKEMKYPKIAYKNGIQGTVYVQFVIDKDGSITEVETVKGVSKELDEEAERVIKIMKNWHPGIQLGQPVKVRMLFPLTFKLP